MGYASTYGCSEFESTHYCHDCPEGIVSEFARIRSSGFIKKAYLATLLAAPITPATWTAGIAAGKIIMIPETSGSFDPSIPKELKGYGEKLSSPGARKMKLSFNDPDYIENYVFYNEISYRDDLVPFYRTSSLVHIFDTVASIVASDPTLDDLEEVIVWHVECTVVSKNLPSKHPTAAILDVFSCAAF